MVIRGGTRGNGKQLADYLITVKDNEWIEILEANGRLSPTPEYMRDTILSMDMMTELTKAQKGLYHAQINPAYHEDKKMDWSRAADILGEELGLADQRRVIVLHQKKGRTHAHVVWERYDHDKQIVRSDSFSRLAQDRARRSMEYEFGHAHTPKRNKHRPELKASLSQLWHSTSTGAEFLHACRNNNYMIAEGSGRDPFVVVDENARSYNLARQLKGVRLKDIRDRLRNETLMKEKAAITYMRNLKDQRDRDEAEKQKAKLKPKPIVEEKSRSFTENAKEQTKQPERPQTQAERDKAFHDYMRNKATIEQDRLDKEMQKTTAKEFADNKHDQTLSESDRIRKALQREREQKNRDPELDRDHGMEWD